MRFDRASLADALLPPLLGEGVAKKRSRRCAPCKGRRACSLVRFDQASSFAGGADVTWHPCPLLLVRTSKPKAPLDRIRIPRSRYYYA
jgi:hypothetical protein